MSIELGPWPGNWCVEAIYELDSVLAIQKFGSMQNENVLYSTTTEVWTENMFKIEEEWTKKGKDWNKTTIKKDKLNRVLEVQIRDQREKFEEESNERRIRAAANFSDSSEESD